MLRKLVVFLAPALAALAQDPCERLKSLSLPHTTVTATDSMPAQGAVPAHCRVAATLRPSSDSDIGIEVRLPTANWNGNYEAVGNGGWAGTINEAEMAAALQRGYATSSTDTGHHTPGASFALGHPEKLIDFGYRSEHEMTVTAKAIIAAFYAAGPKLSYFVGCSSGGRQALMEAQRYPDDYDGIAAGAATNNWNNMMFGRIWVAQATLEDAASYIPPAKYPVIHKAVMEACDALDGVKDGVLEDPTRCHFDPGALACKSADGPACLTGPQVAAARKIYTPARNSRTGTQIFPAMERGSELVWATLAGGPKPIALADDYFKYVVFENPNWDFKTLNFDSDFAKAQKRDGGTLSATNPDLRPFFSHGGKLIQYHGWTDQQVMPRNSIDYYRSVVREMGDAAKTADSYRLFMAPGMNHCGGGEGPNKFDVLGALAQWVENGKAPGSILASRNQGSVSRTRPLCPYPQVAVYKGTGSTDDAANFACKTPEGNNSDFGH
jgi:feruloyl esterase